MKTVLSLSLLLIYQNAYASSIWSELFKKLHGTSQYLTLSAQIKTKPLSHHPAKVKFYGVIEIPSQLVVSRGSIKPHNQAAQLIIDENIVCSYSPSTILSRTLKLVSCSDGSRSGDEMSVAQNISLSLNSTHSSNSAVYVNVKILEKNQSEYGLILPYLDAQEGQVLMFNGEAWIPSTIQTGGSDGEGTQGPQGPQGEPGIPGPQGPQGEAGAIGATGPQGPKGDAGAVGATGPQGPKGDAGAVGAIGPQGPKGDAGAVGAIGPQGPKGDTGAQGAIGPQGPKGDAGAVGAIGPQGPQGEAGPQGPKGDIGATGPQGPKGDTGAQGAMGPQGLQGATGATGPQGLIGPQGQAGAQGEKGEKGDRGEKGERGLSEIAYLRDEKPSGTVGGSCLANDWQTRDLNVLGGDTNFITLSNSHFTLQPGKYFIEAQVPGYMVGYHQARLQADSGNAVLVGSSNLAHPSYGVTNYSTIMGEIIVTSVSTFSIQHRCGTAKSNLGFGIPVNFGTVEIFTQLKIIKKD